VLVSVMIHSEWGCSLCHFDKGSAFPPFNLVSFITSALKLQNDTSKTSYVANTIRIK